MGGGPRLIRRARLAAGLTQAQLARRAGTSQSAVAAYESGAKTPTVDTLERLLRAAGQRLEAAPAAARSRGPTRLSRRLAESRQRILEIASEHGATNVRIFGSVARGDDRTGSDVDLLVEMDERRTLLDQVRLQRELSRLLGVEVDVVSARGLLPRDRALLEEARPL